MFHTCGKHVSTAPNFCSPMRFGPRCFQPSLRLVSRRHQTTLYSVLRDLLPKGEQSWTCWGSLARHARPEACLAGKIAFQGKGQINRMSRAHQVVFPLGGGEVFLGCERGVPATVWSATKSTRDIHRSSMSPLVKDIWRPRKHSPPSGDTASPSPGANSAWLGSLEATKSDPR